ncbi:heme biosynthesis HemY N-terminal domain-containing protein [Loktanella sp. SALINAS62]|uniref:heme biosynthesis protein HemY n=1 Tax=Loktanella sp. SALINAS62 TaxID=2706124 RepID=UPI001B8D00AC|nr:heme biosynthesis HemY N-terminal domain-containing protein [Loktanella sp. SALINAS62]MBS1302414.1 tetratricopeptide repeat protein [Loktanella sp. SALINAS62]
MISTLLKIAVFVAIVTALTWGAVQLMDMQGGAILAIGGYEIALSALQMVFALIFLVVLVWVGLKLLKLLYAVFRFLNGDQTAISRHFDRNRERKGFEALSDSLFAMAGGEGHLAMTKAKRADKYLDRPDLTTLLKAQAAEMTGDSRTAEESYRALVAKDSTRFVGVHGLMQQKLRAGDNDTALGLARKAFDIKPQHEGVQDTLLKLQAEKSDWSGARETLGAKLKSGNLPRDVHKRRDAVLALSEAKDVMDEGQDMKARESAIEANRLSPDLVPAAIMAARAHIEKGEQRKASKILSKTWGVTPHPDIAAAFAEIEPKETPEARLKRFRTLTKQNPDHPETRMLLAELHIAAENFPEAKRALGHLVTDDPTGRSLTLMAAIERGEGSDDAVVRGWLTRALTAPRGPQWICENCQHIHANWSPVCENCSAFDTLAWKRPPAGEVAMPTGTEMLPLIVGQKPAPVNTMTVTDADVLDPIPGKTDDRTTEK